ncbi:CRISPR-associated helicase/endonuclease Cas3 [Photobacterium galatheae]|uniref:CRISPR-associated protein Cas3 n=1 Tax=Photobacterium galatheae TaxID=1654360 RepID=A0A066RMP1_9GAMM|nr:CRISPR-associated helicase/endonuclease Cas3 [Photobacterium galatheae]KDM91670.1 CRISPR-associated protein Cas3 [Photobacterium galatheae]MCM0151587.1 CRISPR-associated helicase/endonuclease Cas3 [Photobacterium galatheae]
MPTYFQYWGKAKRDPKQPGADYHLLPYHCLDVAAVGYLLMDPDKPLTRDLADFLEITPEQLRDLWTFCLALHDLGKFAAAFQQLSPAGYKAMQDPKKAKGYDGKAFRHDRMGLYFWEERKKDITAGLFGETACAPNEIKRAAGTLMILMDCVLGHHGQPVSHQETRTIKRFTEPHNLDDAHQFMLDVIALFQPALPLEKLLSKTWRRRLEQVSWQFAGLAVLADWIGSDQNFFKYCDDSMPLSNYWPEALSRAQKALANTDLNQQPQVRPFTSVHDLFHFDPTPLQAWAETVPISQTPQLFILEDVTGAGKTEAALTLTHRLMQSGVADGFYFGLPTMATSNAMFDRVADHYLQMLALEEGQQPSIVLAHGAREMNERFRDAVLVSGPADADYDRRDHTATAQCNQWLADSRKKALLAPVGVGTIDQALLAVLPRRHQSLRLLGLNRKILIFDEVHAADEYMFELLESLLALHFHQGGSVILLTATLSQKQRQRLSNVWLKAAELPSRPLRSTDFPLATYITADPEAPVAEQALASRASVSREVTVVHRTSFDECLQTLFRAVEAGQCVVWVRNTVNDALEAFEAVRSRMANPDDCLLFHSRFVLADRKVKEDLVLATFGKKAKTADRRGKVLIATQVFQESLDADADVMISDLCPIDDLIQRTGRLHRHTRNASGEYQKDCDDARQPPVLYLHAPVWDDTPEADWLSRDFQQTQFVYRSPGRLWLGLRKLRQLGAIRMPTEARELIEAVYSDASLAQIPPSMQLMEDEHYAKARGISAKAKSVLIDWQQYGYCDGSAKDWQEDQSDISTRYSDRETVEVLLVRETSEGTLVPWVDDDRFAIALSTVKVAKATYADKLAPVPEHLQPAVEALQQRYRQIQFMTVWLPEQDPNFTYHATTGFCERQTQEV